MTQEHQDWAIRLAGLWRSLSREEIRQAVGRLLQAEHDRLRELRLQERRCQEQRIDAVVKAGLLHQAGLSERAEEVLTRDLADVEARLQDVEEAIHRSEFHLGLYQGAAVDLTY